MFESIRRDDNKNVKGILQENRGTALSHDKWGASTIHRAAQYGAQKSVQLLLEFHADPNARSKVTQLMLMVVSMNCVDAE